MSTEKIREIINLIEGIVISEGRRMRHLVDVPGHRKITVFQNPNPEELMKYVSASPHDPKRMLVSGDDLYLWNGLGASHMDIVMELGINSGIRLLLEADELLVRSEDANEDRTSREEAERALTHPSLSTLMRFVKVVYEDYNLRLR